MAWLRWWRQGERGSSMIESSLILTVLLMLSVGLLDAGRGFYQYNQTAAAASYGARWASVVGGLCSVPIGASVSDWCNQDGSTSAAFWSQPGNVPLQAAGVSCPTHYDASFTGYYTVSNYLQSSATSIVGAIAQHFDTSSTSSGLIHGSLMPGLTLSQMRVCIQLTWDSSRSEWSADPGDRVGVVVYYAYQPITPLLTPLHEIDFVSSSTYRID